MATPSMTDLERETTTHPLAGMFGEHGGSDTVSVTQHRLTISDGEGGRLVLEPVEYGDYRHRVAARGRQQRVSVLLSDTALTELARYAAAAAPRVEPADYDTAVRASQDRVEALHRRALNAVTTVITGQRADIASKGGAHMVVGLVERAVHLAVDEVLLAVSEPDTPAVPPLQTLITNARRLERELDQTVNTGHEVIGSLWDRLTGVIYWSLSYARTGEMHQRTHCLVAADELAPLVEAPAVDRVPAYQLRLIRRALAVAALVRSVEPAPIATSQERTM